MKKIFLSAIALMFIASISFGQKEINLKFNLANGESYDYTMDMNISTKGSVNGQAIDVSNVMTMGYHFAVTGASAGWKKLTSTISKIAMSVNTGGVNINYDSDKPVDTSDMVNSTMGKILGSMKGGQFTFIMNEKGDIGYVSGINEMVNRMTNATPDAGPMAAGMSNAFNEENFKQNLKQAFGLYPGKPVKPGDSWTSTTSASNAGVEMQMNNVYTLESVIDNIANVKVNSKISSPQDSSAKVTTSGTITGTVQYDIPSGVAVNGDLETNMNMNVNANGMSIPMTTDVKTKITGKKS